MMDEQDRELLELAARAAGFDALEWVPDNNDELRLQVRGRHCNWIEWNPLDDDGDALRLAVKLGLQYEFDCYPGTTMCRARSPFRVRVWAAGWHKEEIEADGDLLAATRRAITRAAAEIGRAM